MADFDLSVEELRLVACFVADAAEPMVPNWVAQLVSALDSALRSR
ncbi:hypothetical protein [Mycolicibacterium sp. A43C]